MQYRFVNMSHDEDDGVDNDSGIDDNTDKNIVDITLVNNHPKLQGFGLDISGGIDRPYTPQDSGIFVSALRPRGLAERSGRLDVGDKIIEVNGESVLEVNHEDAVALFIADRTKVELRIHKNYDLLLRAAASTPSPSPSVSPGQSSPTGEGSPKKEAPHKGDDPTVISLPGFAFGLALGCVAVVLMRRYLFTGKT